MKKLSESVWMEIHKHSNGDVERKEDDTNIRRLKPVDLGGSVLWADKDLVVRGNCLFTYDEVKAMIEDLNWRLPTRKEVAELEGHNMYYDSNYVYLDDDLKISFTKAGVGYMDHRNQPYTLDAGKSFYGWTSELYRSNSMHFFLIENGSIDYSPDNATDMTVLCQEKTCRLCAKLVRDK